MLQTIVHTYSSTYEQRGGGGEAARERHAALVDHASQSVVAQVRRLGNKRDIPLYVAARSLSWLLSMARSKQWKEERFMRRLVDRSVALSILRHMTAIAPPPPYEVNPLVKLAFVDQTYMQNLHYGSRRHVRVERLNADGTPAETHFHVYVKSRRRFETSSWAYFALKNGIHYNISSVD